MVGIVTRGGGIEVTLSLLSPRRHAAESVVLVTTMSSAFEPVSVTPWSASAPHAHGRDAGKQRAPRCPSAPAAAHVFEPVTLLTAGGYWRREPRRAIAA